VCNSLKGKQNLLLVHEENLSVSPKFRKQVSRTSIPALLFVCTILLAACNRAEETKQPAPGVQNAAAATQSASAQPVADTEAKSSNVSATQPSGPKRYSLTGRVVSVDKPSQSINIDGDEIPGFMSAMQMPYPVKDATLLDKVAPGNKIRAEIVMADEGAYLENIVVADNAPSKHIK
jgi:Cu/Ag efflux protein CusF